MHNAHMITEQRYDIDIRCRLFSSQILIFLRCTETYFSPYVLRKRGVYFFIYLSLCLGEKKNTSYTDIVKWKIDFRILSLMKNFSVENSSVFNIS